MKTNVIPRWCFAFVLVLMLCLRVQANFHLWDINRIYSSADGRVQFIELTCNTTGQEFLNGHMIRCTGPLATNTFTFPSNCPTGTGNKSLLLATPGFANEPGGIVPDYVIPTNFITHGASTLNFGLGQDTVTYNNLPSDGVGSLLRSGANMIVVATNGPKNFAGMTGSIVPVRATAPVFAGGEFRLSFATATNKTYTLEFKDVITNASWQTGSSVAGNGSVRTLTNASAASNRFYRLRAN